MESSESQNNRANSKVSASTGFTLKSIVALCVAKWYWFVISIAICVGIAAFYLASTTPEYTRNAALLIKEDDNNGSKTTSIELSQLGFPTSSSNIDNETRIIQSLPLLKEVVTRLDINNLYEDREGLRKVLLYKQTPALFVQKGDVAPDSISFDFTVNDDKSIHLSDIKIGKEELDRDINTAYGASVKIGKATLAVVEPVWNTSPYIGKRIHYMYMNPTRYAMIMSGKLNVSLKNKQTSVIDISYTSPSIQLADDILLTIVQLYNERWIKDKNQIAVSTSQFINERLAVIEKELGNVDSDISSYKSEHLLPDVNAATQMYMEQSKETEDVIMDLSNQISVAEVVRGQLVAGSLDHPLPSNANISNKDIREDIAKYNELLIERNRLLNSTSEQNPLVMDRTQALQIMRGSINASINAYIAALRAQMQSARAHASSTSGKIAANPSQAKYLLSVERQQKVKEALYLFLLQKREENELTQAFTAYNSSLIEEPYGSSKPTKPRRRMIMLGALLIGVLIPLAVFIIRERIDTKVRGKKDIESLSIPFVGEIPLEGEKRRGIALLRKKQPQERRIVVKERYRGPVNEAFRVLRTNIEYIGIQDMADKKCKVIAITSANPSSGKTFISSNLAKVLAIKGSRVLLIDLDIRKGSLSTVFGAPKSGITDLLIGRVGFSDVVVKGADGTPTLDVIGMGLMPPNPSELLASKKLDELIDTCRADYDYIILDCPPAEIVTDAKVINRLADMTIFVIRAGLFEKDELPAVQEYYDTNRYRNLAILLNATDITSGYGYHRYGYHYGYGRNYGYGDGYTSSKD